jgi:hypothetical protein
MPKQRERCLSVNLFINTVTNILFQISHHEIVKCIWIHFILFLFTKEIF